MVSSVKEIVKGEFILTHQRRYFKSNYNVLLTLPCGCSA